MRGISQSFRFLLGSAVYSITLLQGSAVEAQSTRPPVALPDVSPAREDLPPAPGDLPPTPEELPPAREDLPPTPEEMPPAREDLPPGPGDLPPTPEEMPPAREDLPPAPGDLPPTPEELPPAREDLPPGPGDLPPTPEEMPPATPGAIRPGAAPTGVEPDTAQVDLPPPSGSQLSVEDNRCAICHGESEIWSGENRRLYIAFEAMAEDVHWSRGVNCHDCHGGDPTVLDQRAAHATSHNFRAKPEDPLPGQPRNACGLCHGDAWVELRKGMHAKAGPRDEHDRGTMMRCSTCHGDVSHQLLPTRDARSPMFAEHQVTACGACHERSLEDYSRSVHGHGLLKSGLATTAVCADCHGAHGIYLPADRRSTIHPTNVSETCGACHRFIPEKLERSIHGSHGSAYLAARDGAETSHQMPTCTHCHEGHEIVHPESPRFRHELPHRCGNCHVELSSHHYATSLHGELTELGHVPAAKCSDCHSAHDIVPLSDPQSPLSAENRTATCAKCHPYATANFLQFRPHADHTDRAREPVLYVVYTALLLVIVSVFGFFGFHAVLWFVRSLVHVFQHGGPRTFGAGTHVYRRFAPFDCACHTFVAVSFLGITLSGLAMKYSHHGWARNLAFSMGGFVSTSIWHRVFGVVILGVLVAYMTRLRRRYAAGRRRGLSRAQVLFGPDSLVPNRRDFRDLLGMFRWFFGLGPKPTFDRWAYWEKFDFWAAFAGVVLIGTTGLILWLPNLFCTVLPGITLNVARVVHSTLALLVAGFVIALHFFHAAFRPDKFPAGFSMPTGLMAHQDMVQERPEYLQRLVEDGKLSQLEEPAPSQRELWPKLIGRWVALAAGLGILVAIVLAAFGD